MNKLIHINVTLLLASFVIMGCRTLKTEVERGPATITHPATYAWKAKVTGIVGETRSDPKILDQLVKGMVAQRMGTANIAKAGLAQADLVFDYTANLSIAREELPNSFPSEDRPATMVTLSAKGGLHRNREQELEVRFYETGTLIVTARERKTGEQVWSGTTVIDIEQGDSQNKKVASARHALKSLLKKFP